MKESRLKFVVVLETVLLLFLLVKVVQDYRADRRLKDPDQGLLSKRVYAGLLPAESYLATNFYPLEKRAVAVMGTMVNTVYTYTAELRAFLDRYKGKGFV